MNTQPTITIQENNQVENQILSMILGTFDTVLQSELICQLTDDDFFDWQNKQVFRLLLQMFQNNEKIDYLTFTNFAKERKLLDACGGTYGIADRLSQFPNDIHKDEYIAILKSKAMGRKLMQFCNDSLMGLTNNGNPEDILNKLVKQINTIYLNTKEQVVTLKQSINEVTAQIDKNRSFVQSFTGIPTGFSKYDWQSGGLHKGDLTVIAGRSSQGKTSLALSMADNIAKSGYRVMYFSLEMLHPQLTARIMAMNICADGLSSSKLLFGKLDDASYSTVRDMSDNIGRHQIFYDDRNKSSLDGIVKSVTINAARLGIDVVFVDYLQILSRNGQRGLNEEQVLAEAARRLKNLATDLNICVVALSQLRRYEKGDPEPTSADLRGSGQIEEAADNLILLYRPEYYGIEKYSQSEYRDVTTHGTALFNVSKGRNIGTFAFICGFDGEHTRFYDIDSDSSQWRNSNFEQPTQTPAPRQEERQNFQQTDAFGNVPF